MGKFQDRTERRRFIVTSIEQGDSIRVSDLSAMFSCSDGSIQNDLKSLRSLGLKIGTKRGVIEAKKDKSVSFIRKLEFPAQYKESAVSILSYFSRVLEQKYPNMDAGVSILQKGNTVTLKIETNEGEIETIVSTLRSYGQVVTGQLAPADFFNEPSAILELNNRLEIAKLELRLKEQSHLMFASSQEKRIDSLENQLSELRGLIGSQLTTVSSLAAVIKSLSDSNRVSPSVSRALDTVTRLVTQKYSEDNELKLRESLTFIQSEDSGLFKKLFSSASTIGHSVVANLCTPWVISVLNSLPK